MNDIGKIREKTSELEKRMAFLRTLESFRDRGGAYRLDFAIEGEDDGRMRRSPITVAIDKMLNPGHRAELLDLAIIEAESAVAQARADLAMTAAGEARS